MKVNYSPHWQCLPLGERRLVLSFGTSALSFLTDLDFGFCHLTLVTHLAFELCNLALFEIRELGAWGSDFLFADY